MSCAKRASGIPVKSAERTAAMNVAVPAVASQLKLKTAG